MRHYSLLSSNCLEMNIDQDGQWLLNEDAMKMN
jgi:hypothetical protein